MTRELYEAFIGSRNGIYYLAKFDAFEKRGDGFVATWNWPAFLFNSVWALYRKQYGWFFAFWGIATVASFAEKLGLPWLGVVVILTSMVFFGLYANALYYKRAKRILAEATAVIENPSKRIEVLASEGWRSWMGTVGLHRDPGSRRSRSDTTATVSGADSRKTIHFPRACHGRSTTESS